MPKSIPVPSQVWNDDPQNCLGVSDEWLPIVIGYIKDLRLKYPWDDTDQDANADVCRQANEMVFSWETRSNFIRIPDWEPVLNPNQSSYGILRNWLGQRGEGKNGAFYDYAGLLQGSRDFLFHDVHTLAYVGGLVSYAAMASFDPSDVLTISYIDTAGFFGYAAATGEVYITTPVSMRSITFSGGNSVHIRLVIKNNWTWGNL